MTPGIASQPGWVFGPRANEECMVTAEKDLGLDLDSKSVSEAIGAAIEGCGAVFDALKVVAKRTRSIDGGVFFARWLLGQCDASELHASQSSYLLNLARCHALRWALKGDFYLRIAAIVAKKLERMSKTPEQPQDEDEALLDRLARIGQWPSSLVVQKPFKVEGDGETPCTIPAWLFAWHMDRDTLFKLTCPMFDDKIGALPRPHRANVPEIQQLFWRPSLEATRSLVSLDEDHLREEFLVRVTQWLDFSTGPNDLFYLVLPDRSKLADTSLRRLCRQGRYCPAAYELGARGQELGDAVNGLRGKLAADMRKSWTEGVEKFACRLVSRNVRRITAYEYKQAVEFSYAFRKRALLRVWGKIGVMVIDPDRPFARGPVVDSSAYLDVPVTFEDAVHYLKIDGQYPRQ